MSALLLVADGGAGALVGGLMGHLLVASAKASVALLLVLALRALAGRRLPPRWRTALWLPVALRLVLPVGPHTRWSLFALAPDAAAVPGSGRLLPGLAGGPTPGAGAGAPADHAWTHLVALLRAAAPDVLLALAAVWLLGLAVLAVRRRRALGRLAALLRRRKAVDDPAALRLLAACRAALGLRRPAELAEAAGVAGPCLAPPRRGRPPCILLPPGAAAALGEDRLRHVLLHELAHLAHRDLGVRRLAGALCALHWFNPLVHLAARAVRADQELAADERALALLAPAERRCYGRTLLDLLPGAAAEPSAAAFVENRHQLHRRISMIARFAPRHRFAALAAALLVLAVAGVVLTDGGAQAAPVASVATPATAGDGAAATAAAADATDPAAAQRRALSEMRAIGVAMMTWLVDHPTETSTEQPADAPWDWSSCPRIAYPDLVSLLVPRYADALPKTDPWGHDYEFCLDRSGTADGHVVGVRSAGSDGRFTPPVYSPGGFPPDRDEQDLVWMDGMFVRWPEKPAE